MAEGDVDYFYFHETPNLTYRVEAKPPPADSSKAEFHLDHPKGKVIHTENLKREGEGTFPFHPKKHGITFESSPIFVVFTFKKGKESRENVVVISLAEPAVRAIEAPPEASPGETVTVRVISWDAMAWDLPGLATVLEEKHPDRVIPDERAKVRWWVEGKQIDAKGEVAKVKILDEHLGKTLPVVAYLGEKLPKSKMPARAMVSAVRKPWAEPARASIHVPRVKIEGPDSAREREQVSLKATIEPPLEGSFAWTGTHHGSKEKGPAGEGAETKLAARDGGHSVECKFTSKSTGRAYSAKHDVKVIARPKRLAIDLEKHPRIFSGKTAGELTLTGAAGSETVDAASGKDVEPWHSTVYFITAKVGQPYTLKVKPANGAKEYVVFKDRAFSDEQFAPEGEEPKKRVKLVIPRLVYEDLDTKPLKEKHIYIDVPHEGPPPPPPQQQQPPPSGGGMFGMSMPAMPSMPDLPPPPASPFLHARTDKNGRLCAIAGEDEKPTYPLWLAATAKHKIRYSNDPIEKPETIEDKHCQSVKLQERDIPPGIDEKSEKGGGGGKAVKSSPALAAPAGDAPKKEHVFKLKRVRVTLPIAVDFRSTEDATSWKDRNPIEVTIDEKNVPCGVFVDNAKSKLMVEFGVEPGKHAIVVSAKPQNSSNNKLVPKRIMFISRTITVHLPGEEPPQKPVEAAPMMMTATLAPMAMAQPAQQQQQPQKQQVEKVEAKPELGGPPPAQLKFGRS